MKIPPKAKIFAWLLLRGRLKTRAFLACFMNDIDFSYALCGTAVENINHLFRSCSFSNSVWTSAGNLPSPSNFPNVEVWLEHIMDNEPRSVFKDYVIVC